MIVNSAEPYSISCGTHLYVLRRYWRSRREEMDRTIGNLCVLVEDRSSICGQPEVSVIR